VKSYNYADGLLGFLSLAAWAGMIVTIATGLFIGWLNGDLLLPLLVVVPAIVCGAAILALAQVGRAVIDIARNSEIAARLAQQRLDAQRLSDASATGQF
jgi:hypothetical protein